MKLRFVLHVNLVLVGREAAVGDFHGKALQHAAGALFTKELDQLADQQALAGGDHDVAGNPGVFSLLPGPGEDLRGLRAWIRGVFHRNTLELGRVRRVAVDLLGVEGLLLLLEGQLDGRLV